MTFNEIVEKTKDNIDQIEVFTREGLWCKFTYSPIGKRFSFKIMKGISQEQLSNYFDYCYDYYKYHQNSEVTVRTKTRMDFLLKYVNIN